MGLLRKLVLQLASFIEEYGFTGWFLTLSVALFVVISAWSIPVLLFNPWAPYFSSELPAQAPEPSITQPAPESLQASLEAIAGQIAWVTPTPSPQPGRTYDPGIYVVGDQIQPGLYRSQLGEGAPETCYWARLRDLTESTDSIIAYNSNPGQFYVEVKATDHALQVYCSITSLDPNLPQVAAFPNRLAPGMYLIGAEILPGQYRGQAGDSPCTWQLLSGVDGEPGSVISSGKESEEFLVEVLPSDFALATDCFMDRVE